jgi:hypothetical protein
LPSYFVPLLFLRPAEESISVSRAPFRLVSRKWTTSTFDLATLATKHRLHLSYQLMDVLLAHCNLELEIDAPNFEAAIDALTAILLGMYLTGVSPTLAPFATTHSVNDYSGINSRDSELLRPKLPQEQRVGLMTGSATVEAWPLQMSLQCMVDATSLAVSEWQFHQAATKASSWLDVESTHRMLRVVRDAAQAAPTLVPAEQALLHVWCALEALFPKVSAEVSFRIALYLAQLSSPSGQRLEYFERVRKAYNLRSRVAHGAEARLGQAEWRDTWGLLIDACNAIVRRGRLPSEDDLLSELLASPELLVEQRGPAV